MCALETTTFKPTPVSHRHYRVNINLATVTYSTRSPQQPTDLLNFNIGKRVFCVTAPTIWSEFPITI